MGPIRAIAVVTSTSMASSFRCLQAAAKAQEYAQKNAEKAGGSLVVDLRCPSNFITIAGCNANRCFLVGYRSDASEAPIAGLGRVKKPRRKRTGPPTAKQRAAQERFSNAAAQCKGDGDYRSCMKRKLKK